VISRSYDLFFTSSLHRLGGCCRSHRSWRRPKCAQSATSNCTSIGPVTRRLHRQASPGWVSQSSTQSLGTYFFAHGAEGGEVRSGPTAAPGGAGREVHRPYYVPCPSPPSEAAGRRPHAVAAVSRPPGAAASCVQRAACLVPRTPPASALGELPPLSLATRARLRLRTSRLRGDYWLLRSRTGLGVAPLPRGAPARWGQHQFLSSPWSLDAPLDVAEEAEVGVARVQGTQSRASARAPQGAQCMRSPRCWAMMAMGDGNVCEWGCGDLVLCMQKRSASPKIAIAAVCGFAGKCGGQDAVATRGGEWRLFRGGGGGVVGSQTTSRFPDQPQPV
jgi:hypothetical protein